MSKRNFVICIDNSGYPASLEKRKIYQVVPDEKINNRSQIRVIDESGEDYVYPSKCFIEVGLTSAVEEALLKAVTL